MDIAQIAGGLTHACRVIMTHDRFDPKGWEPSNPFSPICRALVDEGLFTRANGRCGFEAFKDSFIVPTPLGLAVREYLLSPAAVVQPQHPSHDGQAQSASPNGDDARKSQQSKER